jgi:hypothetical protein
MQYICSCGLYGIRSHIAFAGETHTMAEILIKPCAFQIAEYLLDDQIKKNKFEKIQLSHNIFHRFIQDIR